MTNEELMTDIESFLTVTRGAEVERHIPVHYKKRMAIWVQETLFYITIENNTERRKPT